MFYMSGWFLAFFVSSSSKTVLSPDESLLTTFAVVYSADSRRGSAEDLISLNSPMGCFILHKYMKKSRFMQLTLRQWKDDGVGCVIVCPVFAFLYPINFFCCFLP